MHLVEWQDGPASEAAIRFNRTTEAILADFLKLMTVPKRLLDHQCDSAFIPRPR